MTNINQTSVKTLKKSKAWFALLIIALVILALTGGYFFYAQGLLKTTETGDTDQISKTTKKNKVVSDGVQVTPRDPDRYYNDEGRYSFVIPEGMKARIPGNFSDTINKSTTQIASEFPVPVDAISDWLPFANISIKKPEQFTSDITCSSNTINGYSIKQCSTYSDLVKGTWYINEIKAWENKAEIISIAGADKKVIYNIIDTIQAY